MKYPFVPITRGGFWSILTHPFVDIRMDNLSEANHFKLAAITFHCYAREKGNQTTF